MADVYEVGEPCRSPRMLSEVTKIPFVKGEEFQNNIKIRNLLLGWRQHHDEDETSLLFPEICHM